MSWFSGCSGSLLDVGCGSCEHDAQKWCVDNGIDYTGVDYSVRSSAGVIADAQLLPFSDSSFDMVSALGSIEHFDSPVQGIREIYRVCRPCGRVVISVPNHLGILEDIGLYKGTEQPQELRLPFLAWRDMIESTGLKVMEWARDYGASVFKNWKPIKIIQRLMLKCTRFLPQSLSYQFIYRCVK